MTALHRIRGAIRFTSVDVDPDEHAERIARIVAEARTRGRHTLAAADFHHQAMQATRAAAQPGQASAATPIKEER